MSKASKIKAAESVINTGPNGGIKFFHNFGVFWGGQNQTGVYESV